jgi:hypothetical protein
MSLGCGALGVEPSDTAVDASQDHSVLVADAEVGRTVRDASVELDPGPTIGHDFIDAAVQCDGGTPWGPCNVTDAAELACEASSDCTWQANGGTCCGVPTVGVNKSAPYVGCPGLPCAPPKEYQSVCHEYFTQDCQAVDAASDIIVACVEHRCLTRASSN